MLDKLDKSDKLYSYVDKLDKLYSYVDNLDIFDM